MLARAVEIGVKGCAAKGCWEINVSKILMFDTNDVFIV